MGVFKDLIGLKVGKLLVIELVERGKKDSLWKCQYDCGNIKVMKGSSIRDKRTKSCGCLRQQNSHLRTQWSVYDSYKNHAKERGLNFELTKDEFYNLTQLNCTYCGIPPSTHYTDKRANSQLYIYNGVDRSNNSIGYIKENCVLCCKRCNIIKNNMTLEDFLNHIERIYFFSIKDK